MSTAEELEDALSSLDLPSGTYAAVVHDQMHSPEGWPPEIVVWTDRPYDTCPICSQRVTRDTACALPVQLNQGSMEAFSQQHGCGQWLAVPWQAVRGTGEGCEVTRDDVLRVVEELTEVLSSTHRMQRDEIEARLREQLTEALHRLDEPLEQGETREDRAEEVRTGNEVDPGIYWGGHWLAWNYDPGAPAGSGDLGLIEVHESELREARRV